ncbi:hypothetical protein TRFO_32965 [Tritrichomonas foetus]|uniref:Uncharacterized protein n=1 Tax=Tritrichomonas foetus TaxID=1144522 RepID=A0A1J4JNS8_9EUKA|nr:hypothetical protein TRFO_32965 [Tritrichomonas foetus]|eukprot:OHT00378.1 hypothetical protein TRFO_32965 [Tritrichomonas foetus]
MLFCLLSSVISINRSLNSTTKTHFQKGFLKNGSTIYQHLIQRDADMKMLNMNKNPLKRAFLLSDTKDEANSEKEKKEVEKFVKYNPHFFDEKRKKLQDQKKAKHQAPENDDLGDFDDKPFYEKDDSSKSDVFKIGFGVIALIVVSLILRKFFFTRPIESNIEMYRAPIDPNEQLEEYHFEEVDA